MSGCPAMPGQRRCPPSICDCFIDIYPDDPGGIHPEAFVVGRLIDPGADETRADATDEWQRDLSDSGDITFDNQETP